MAQRRHTLLLALSLVATVPLAACQSPVAVKPRIPVPEAAACTSQNLSAEALFSGAKRGVAVISTENAEGSGFIVRHQDGNTLLVSNAHVVEGRDTATVKWADGGEDSAAVLSSAGGTSPQTDLALLQVRGIRGKVLDLRTSQPNVGADVVAIGAPKGLEFSLTRGVVSSLRDDGSILQIDAPINPGNSGGPVLDRTGCVVGIATFKLNDSEGLNFAVASSVIDRFLLNPGGQAAPDSRPEPSVPAAPFNPSNPGSGQSSGATCWFQMQADSERLEGFRCDVSSRTNANGHTVFDVVEPNGLKRTVVLWQDKTAEVLINGESYEGEWLEDDEGDIRVRVGGGVFAFRYRG
jgi:serine protease Do